MSRKILIPLDGSEESEEIVSLIQRQIEPDDEVTLLQVIPPLTTLGMAGRLSFFAGHQEESRRSRAMSYLQGVVSRRCVGSAWWRCEVVVAESVTQAIVDLAIRESVGLIAMHTHDRKGLAGLIKGSIAKDVRRRSPIDVRIIKPLERVGVA